MNSTGSYKISTTEISEAYQLNKGELFLWQDRMYVVVDDNPGQSHYILVIEVASYWPHDNRWVFRMGNTHEENFNAYCNVEKLTGEKREILWKSISNQKVWLGFTR